LELSSLGAYFFKPGGEQKMKEASAGRRPHAVASWSLARKDETAWR